MTGVARGKKKEKIIKKKLKIFFLICLAYVTPGTPLGSLKKFSLFGPAVSPAVGNINTNVLFYYTVITRKQWNRKTTFK